MHGVLNTRYAALQITDLPALAHVSSAFAIYEADAVVFERTLPWVSDQQLGSRRITISMPEKGWSAAPAADSGGPSVP